MQTGGWIGDMVLLTPVLRSLKRRLVGSCITLMVRPLVSELMSMNPYIDKLIVYDKRQAQRGVRKFWEIAQNLKKQNFDLAVVLHPTSIRSALLAWLARIPERIGTNVGGRKIFLTDSMRDCKEIHEVERYLRVLELIGIHEPNCQLEFWHTDEHRDFAHRFLERNGICHSKPLVGINIGTTWQSKQWSVEKFAEVIENLDANILITGSSSERALARKLRKITETNLIDSTGKTDIFQLAALIECCDCYITCDSGPMHISAAVDTRTIALFGPTDPIRHRPYGGGHTVVEKSVECRPCYNRKCKLKSNRKRCMKEIMPDDVLAAVTN